MRRYAHLRRAGLAALLVVGASLGPALAAAPNAVTKTAIAASGTWSKPQHLDSATSLMTSVSCTGPGFCMAMDTIGNAFTWNGHTWSGPQRVDPSGGGAYLISCPTTTFCAEIGGSSFGPGGGGNARTWNGTNWSGPTAADPGQNIAALSCASAMLCAAVDGVNHAVVWNGRTWTSQAIGLRPLAVSCTRPTFCLVLFWDETYSTRLGQGWSNQVPLEPMHQICDSQGHPCQLLAASASCPDPHFCMVVSREGDAFAWHGGQTWSEFHLSAHINAVSCARSDVCLAVDYTGHAFTWNGTTWSPAATIDANAPLNSLQSVSCPTVTFCAAVDNSGNALIGTLPMPAPQPTGPHATPTPATPPAPAGSLRWSKPQLIDPNGSGFSAMSCPSPTFCLAANQSYDVLMWNGRRWSRSPSIFGAPRLAGPVSCPRATFCMALASDETVVWWNGHRWSAPVQAFPQGTSVYLSCATPTFCMALGTSLTAAGLFASTWNGIRWSGPTRAISSDTDLASTAGFGHNSGISCPSADFCMAVTSTLGHTYSWNGRGWSQAVALPVDPFGRAPNLEGISCASAHLCVAAGDDGFAYTWNGAHWLAPVEVVPGGNNRLNAVSCPTTTFCAAVDNGQYAYTWNGQVWTQSPALLPYGDALDVISCASPRFCVAGDRQRGDRPLLIGCLAFSQQDQPSARAQCSC